MHTYRLFRLPQLSLRWPLALAMVLHLSITQAREIAPKVSLPSIPRRTLNLAAYGGIGDGKAMNTEAFSNAIAQLSKKGGGHLDVPPGIWLTGPIRLASRIDLHLERGALIKFASDPKLFPLTVISLKGEKEVDSISPIFGQDLVDVSITGEGIIDGSGDAWRPIKKGKLGDADWKALVKSGGVTNAKGDTWYPSPEVMAGEKAVNHFRTNGSLNISDYEPYHQFLRPKMVRIIGCKRLLLQGVTFENPPNWTLNPVLCEDVSILDVFVLNSPVAQNSDALDLESCRHGIIRGCIFDTGDDGICIKSGKDAAGRRIGVPTEDVLVEDCTVYHAHGGFTIGSEMSGDVRNMWVTNCTFIGTDVGLRFKSVRGRGGVVENIFISNVRMQDIGANAIDFNMYYENKSALEAADATGENKIPPVSVETPQFRDIHIENVICRGAQKAAVLQGLPEMPIRNITLKNVSITSQTGVFLTDADGISFDGVQIENKTGEAVNQTRVKNSSLELLK